MFRIFINPYEYELFGTLTGNLEICKFKTYNSTRRTICFIQSCHVRSRNTVPFITVKINSNSEGKVASWNAKRMKMNKQNQLQNLLPTPKPFLPSFALGPKPRKFE